jgi:hypothetical protein
MSQTRVEADSDYPTDIRADTDTGNAGLPAEDAPLPTGPVDGSGSAAPYLLRLSVYLGVGLMIVQALYLLFVAYTGLSLTRGETTVKASPLMRIGITFASHVNVPVGLCLVVAVALLAAPAAAPRYRHALTGTRTTALVAIQILAILIIIGSGLAVRATVYFLPPLVHHLSHSQKWELTAYVIGTAGTALLALGAAVASLPRFVATDREM